MKAHQFKPNGTMAIRVRFHYIILLSFANRKTIAVIDYWRDECLELTSHDGNQLFGEFIQVGCPIDDAERVLIYREDVVHDCEETIAAYINDLSSNDTLEKVYFYLRR